VRRCCRAERARAIIAATNLLNIFVLLLAANPQNAAPVLALLAVSVLTILASLARRAAAANASITLSAALIGVAMTLHAVRGTPAVALFVYAAYAVALGILVERTA